MSLRTKTKHGVGAVRLYPTDLVVVTVVAALAYLAVTSLPDGSGIRLLAALPLIAFLPGYALVAVLFPTTARPARRSRATVERYPRGIDAVERAGLSFVLSLVVVALVALVLVPTRWELSTAVVAAAVGGTTIAFAQLGALRRVRVPDADRYEVSFGSAIRRIRPARGDGAAATATSLLLGVGIAAAVVALGVSFAWPAATGGFTELGLFVADDDGELVADEYPDELAPDETASLVAEIENGQDDERSYTIVVQQQRVIGETITDRTELDRLSATVGAGETATIEHELAPTATNETVRVTYLLYEDEPPAFPTLENADEDVYVWVDVTDGTAAADESA